MKKREPVSHIMSKNVFTVNQTNKLEDAYQIMIDNGVHHVPVVSGNQVIGILSQSDIDRISFVSGVEKNKALTTVFDMLSIEQVMTSDVQTVQPNHTIKEVAEIFAKGNFHALPVLNGEGLAGIVTSTDIFNYLLEQY